MATTKGDPPQVQVRPGPPPASRVLKIEHLRRLDVKPGDKFVMMSDVELTEEQMERIQAAWQLFIGDVNAQLLVLPPGWEVGVIRPESSDAA